SASLDSDNSSSLAEGSLATAVQERSDTSTADTRYDAIENTSSPMHNQLEDVARAYSDSTRFPPYSQPLSENDWAALNPRAFTASERPLANAPSLKVSIELPQYVLDRSQDLPVKVVVANEGETANTSVLRVTGGQVLIRHGAGDSSPVALASTVQNGIVETFLATIPAAELATLPDSEITVAAQLTLSDGKSAVVTAVAQLYQSAANLNYLGSAYVDGAHLVIPAHFDVISPGFYRVQANLFSQSGVPVSHLNASFVLAGGSAIGLLKAHATTLREKDIAGPYLLTDINVMRMPSAPGEQTGYGSTSQASYPVSGFPLTSYSDEPYEDPATQQRIRFLEALSEKGL
ncbi:MAG: hypothetical protein V2I38_12965, partial [Alcanivoracaceae bacterium]|nr:hypothetical protein [Alcanivoracaceae bacterium]